MCPVALCCVLSCRVVLRCVVLCCVVLYRVFSCCVVLCRAVPCRAWLCYVVPCRVLLCCVVLCCVVLCCVILYCIMTLWGVKYLEVKLLLYTWLSTTIANIKNFLRNITMALQSVIKIKKQNIEYRYNELTLKKIIIRLDVNSIL